MHHLIQSSLKMKEKGTEIVVQIMLLLNDFSVFDTNANIIMVLNLMH